MVKHDIDRDLTLVVGHYGVFYDYPSLEGAATAVPVQITIDDSVVDFKLVDLTVPGPVMLFDAPIERQAVVTVLTFGTNGVVSFKSLTFVSVC